MSGSVKQIAEQHLVSLWAAVRDASALLRRGDADELLSSPHLTSLMQALALDARRLARLIESRQVGAQPWPDALPPTAERARVLVVDDDASATAALRELLSDEFETVGTVDPTAAQQLIREGSIDAVVTDLRMPGLDGMALLELIQRGGAQSPPVLLMSGSFDERLRLDALERGAFDVIPKPVDLPELKARLHRAVRYTRELNRQHTLQGTDELTGLLNRRAFKAALVDALKDRRAGSPALSVAMIDQDGLKRVNDAYGHARGDEAIATVAFALKRARRGTDLAARLGGDEFALLMPGTDRLGAERVLERVLRELSAAPLPLAGGASLPLTVSYGIATLTLDDRFSDGAALLERADAALYEMKHLKRSGHDDAGHTTH